MVVGLWYSAGNDKGEFLNMVEFLSYEDWRKTNKGLGEYWEVVLGDTVISITGAGTIQFITGDYSENINASIAIGLTLSSRNFEDSEDGYARAVDFIKEYYSYVGE